MHYFNIYIFFLIRNFFLNLHLDRVHSGALRVFRFRRSIFRRFWANREKTREGMSGVHYKGERSICDLCNEIFLNFTIITFLFKFKLN